MNIRRKYCGRVLTVAMVTLFGIAVITSVGCGESTEASTEPPIGSQIDVPLLSAEHEGSDGQFPVVVRDLLDRSVRLKKRPVRIVSLTPSTTELLFAIGAGQQIVGATQHCNYPPKANDVPRVGGGTLESISREQLLYANPDLVLCKWDNHAPLIDMLEEFEIPALGLGPETLDDLYKEISVLGRVTGREASANRLTSEMKQRVALLTDAVSEIPIDRRRSVFYQVWDEPLMTAGPNSFIGEILELAGTQNIFADTDTRYPRVSAEVVISRNPDVILAPSTHATEVNREDIFNRPGWDQVNALRQEQIFLIDGDRVSRCGPRLIDALEEVIRLVYPEQHEAIRRPTESSASEDTVR